MGVSGCGKSSLGERLADELGAVFIEGDSFHPPQNVQRMAAGIALTDDDRQGWLEALAAQLADARAQGHSAVLACSALKRRYRDALRQGDPGMRVIHLAGDRALLASRLAARQGHYMPATLLPSQLATLEPPQPDENALTLDIAAAPATLLRAIMNTLEPVMSDTPTYPFGGRPCEQGRLFPECRKRRCGPFA